MRNNFRIVYVDDKEKTHLIGLYSSYYDAVRVMLFDSWNGCQLQMLTDEWRTLDHSLGQETGTVREIIERDWQPPLDLNLKQDYRIVYVDDDDETHIIGTYNSYYTAAKVLLNSDEGSQLQRHIQEVWTTVESLGPDIGKIQTIDEQVEDQDS